MCILMRTLYNVICFTCYYNKPLKSNKIRKATLATEFESMKQI